ncbi:MAG TPA: SDR family NAD(P)-dependent oxidoreductase [Solirubrobacteraceae bacterium]|nr:SDR family NAD(P)-dependent oxidoreductase [Solirubrobacteraceae bacterium]
MTDTGTGSGRLAGRTALVTGAAGGIGGAIAEAYAREGADVCLADRSVSSGLNALAEHCRRHGTSISHVVGDVADVGDVEQMVATATDALGGRIDVLVNAAGIATESSVEAMPVEMWDEMIRVDLRSVFLCSHAVLPGMLERGWGRIISIASQLGIKGATGLAHYCAAKAGVIGFTKSLAQEVAERGVLVNAIAPGPIDTPILDGLSEEWKAAKRAELPLGRFGVPEEVAPTAVLLAAEPDSNLYVGQVLGPNSGDVMP